MTRPRTSGRRLSLRPLLLVPLLAAGGCAAPLGVPPVAVVEQARRVPSYSARLGGALAASEVMDLPTGVRSPRLVSYVARWGAALPAHVDANLADGTRLKVSVQEPEAPAPLGEAAFAEPPHEGYHAITLDQARTLWSR